MGLEREHREAVVQGRRLGFMRVQVPNEHRSALVREQRRFRAERERLRSELRAHHELLDTIRERLERDRTYYRRAYEQDRWLIALAERALRGLAGTPGRRAA